jgi:transcriptional regulator
MYLPRPDQPTDADQWRDFLRRHPFGQLVAAGRGRDVPVISPTPFVLDDDDTVLLHLATPNPIWAAIEENPLVVLAVIGDVAHIPGPWKAIGDEDPTLGVPTQYYGAVQLTARVELLPETDAALDVLRRMIDAFEVPADLADPQVHTSKLAGIRAARLHTQDVKAKFKYGGNVDVAHRLAVAERLAVRGDPGDREARATLLKPLENSGNPPFADL